MDPEFIQFQYYQLRILRQYCKLHPELTENEACMKFIENYAKKLRYYYEDIQSYSCES